VSSTEVTAAFIGVIEMPALGRLTSVGLGSSSSAKSTLADFRISFARRSSKFLAEAV
jgi:hypothetical protein